MRSTDCTRIAAAADNSSILSQVTVAMVAAAADSPLLVPLVVVSRDTDMLWMMSRRLPILVREEKRN